MDVNLRTAVADTEMGVPPFRIMNDRVLVLPDKEPDKTRGGIIIPDTAKKRGDRELHSGRMVMMGPGMLRFDGTRMAMPDCKPGDRILYHPGGTRIVTIADKKYLSMRDDNVFAVVEED